MSRRARLTVLELGASGTAWASCHGLGADDWIVVAQQQDEPAPAFSERVSQRARRLCREDALLEAIDLYTGPRSDGQSVSARRAVIEALGGQMAQGGRLTLWSGAKRESQNDTELHAILAHFGPLLATRHIAMNHQACDIEERSGVRHAIPAAPRTGFDALTDFEEFA
jgi:hypothetical protein